MVLQSPINKKFAYFSVKMRGFAKIVTDNMLFKILPFANLSLGHVSYHTKFESDLLSRKFIGYINKQTNRK